MNHEAWIYAKRACKLCNGKAAFCSIFDHYLGSNNVNHMTTKEERKLLTTTYHGKKKQHNILKSIYDYGQNGIDEHLKVWYLNDGIKNTKLDIIKSATLVSLMCCQDVLHFTIISLNNEEKHFSFMLLQMEPVVVMMVVLGMKI